MCEPRSSFKSICCLSGTQVSLFFFGSAQTEFTVFCCVKTEREVYEFTCIKNMPAVQLWGEMGDRSFFPSLP